MEDLTRTAYGSQNGDATLPDSCLHFTENGVTFSIDVIEAHDKLNEILEAVKGTTDYSYLKLLGEWVRQLGGPELKPGKLDALWHLLRLRHSDLKKKQRCALESSLNWQTSTDASPEDSAA